MSPEQNFTIDGTEYPLTRLSDEARSQLQMLRITDQEIQRLQSLAGQDRQASMAQASSVLAR